MSDLMSEAGSELNSPQPAARPHISFGAVGAMVAVLALLTVLAFGLARSSRGSIKLGETTPNFTLNSFEGQSYALKDMRGKVVLINFWASWCKPCEQEAPFLEEAWSIYKDRGDVVFLGVDYTDTPSAASAYLKKFHVSYPNGPDLGTKISHDYRITGVPETYILDKTGKLSYTKFSPFLSTAEIQQAIDPLLSH